MQLEVKEHKQDMDIFNSSLLDFLGNFLAKGGLSEEHNVSVTKKKQVLEGLIAKDVHLPLSKFRSLFKSKAHLFKDPNPELYATLGRKIIGFPLEDWFPRQSNKTKKAVARHVETLGKIAFASGEWQKQANLMNCIVEKNDGTVGVDRDVFKQLLSGLSKEKVGGAEMEQINPFIDQMEQMMSSFPKR